MKNAFFILTILFLSIGCKNTSEEKKETPVISTEASSNCTNKTTYGNTSICLPKIKGSTEAYSVPEVRKRANEFEDTNNTILGYYLDNTTYQKISDFSTISYDNYYKVYAPTAATDVKMGPSEMKQILEMMTTGFLDKSIEDVNKNNLFTDKDLEITQPILLEKYPLTKNASVIIFLMNITSEDTTQIKAASMSTVLAKERLIFIAHYLDYKDETTLTKLKEHTATFTHAFIDANS